MKLLLVCLIGLVVAPQVYGADCAWQHEQRYRDIREARFVAGISVGIEGLTPEAARAYRCILSRPDARELFRELLEHARLPGKMYALAGLYVVDRPAFERSVKGFEHQQTRVHYIDGCSGTSKPIAYFATILKSGQFSATLAYDLDAARIKARQTINGR